MKEKATIREGREKSSRKIGELSKGMVVDVVEEGATDSQGLRLVRLQPPTPGVDRTLMPSLYPNGGWVKIETSKGKVLLEELRTQRGATAAAMPSDSAAAEDAEVEETARCTDL